MKLALFHGVTENSIVAINGEESEKRVGTSKRSTFPESDILSMVSKMLRSHEQQQSVQLLQRQGSVFDFGKKAIFGLFCCFWLRLNMFTTLKYLAGLGTVTFISGHGMLTQLTQKK
ncbi:hypothetical protein HPB51_021113 [Rhipicephalus microplus]|uniref:Ribophorin II C-terminal domain-containing protein n=1 Tax=Rhipicephalus microplus TaxID=6941 RepID=A0A9J6DWD0_RHIMP|nr:hypothetical protein HPB51_021113 [Rhipicephalus microplus]